MFFVLLKVFGSSCTGFGIRKVTCWEHGNKKRIRRRER